MIQTHLLPPSRSSPIPPNLEVSENGHSCHHGPQQPPPQLVRRSFPLEFLTYFDSLRFGALYIGTVASAILYGICVLQAFLYFRGTFTFISTYRQFTKSPGPGYRQDTWRIKAAVRYTKVTPGMSTKRFCIGDKCGYLRDDTAVFGCDMR